MSLDNLEPSLYPEDEPQLEEEEESTSAGKLLGIFFGAAAVCALFFGLGYNLGKNAGAQNAQIIVPASAASNASNIPKPSAARAPEAVASAGEASPELTKTAADSSSSGAAAVPARPAPEMVKAASAAGNFAVQVAAVSKEEDADALVSALRKKNYPVFVINGNAADKLFHVQVGPFASLADAEAMKSRLAGDGYNPILKK